MPLFQGFLLKFKRTMESVRVWLILKPQPNLFSRAGLLWSSVFYGNVWPQAWAGAPHQGRVILLGAESPFESEKQVLRPLQPSVRTSCIYWQPLPSLGVMCSENPQSMRICSRETKFQWRSWGEEEPKMQWTYKNLDNKVNQKKKTASKNNINDVLCF